MVIHSLRCAESRCVVHGNGRGQLLVRMHDDDLTNIERRKREAGQMFLRRSRQGCSKECIHSDVAKEQQHRNTIRNVQLTIGA